MSKTWIASMIGMLLLQLLENVQGQGPAVINFLLQLSPDWLDPMVSQYGPFVFAWLVAKGMVFLRNDAVKTGTIASSNLGVKKNFEATFLRRVV